MRAALVSLLVIVVVLLVGAMIRAFIRNAVELRRDVNKRFDDLSARLADEAKATIDPLLDRDRDDKMN